MGAFLMVEADYSGEPHRALTRLPTHGGKAVLNFLLALNWFCDSDESKDTDWDKKSRKWFQYLQTQIGQPLANVFKPMMDCMWGDDGEFAPDFLEDEYEWYVKRNPNPNMTEAEFQQSVREGMKHWSSVDEVMANAKLLIELFKTKELSKIDGLYTPEQMNEDMIPGFASLYDTLDTLKRFYFEAVVRLTFY